MAQGTQGTTGTVGTVSVQTLRGTQGHAAALASVQAAVQAYNKANPKAVPHVVASVTALPNNVKGMQWQLALLATLARQNACTMVRLSVHNGHVALCGPAAGVQATQAAMVPTYNQLVTMAAAAYNPATHGNRVGFTNAYLCGVPAGMPAPTAQLAYGLGYLFTFVAPGNATAYAMGYAAGTKLAAKPVAPKAPKAPKAAKPAVAAAAPAAPAAPAAAAPAAAAPANAANAA